MIGRIRIDRLSAMKRVPLDADDLRDMAFSRARASAGTVTSATATRPLPRPSPAASFPVSPDGVHQARGGDNDITTASSGRAEGQASAHTSVSASSAVNHGNGGGGDGSGEGGGGGKGGGRAYGIAAFCLDSSCEVGRVALVYGGSPTVGDTARRGVSVGRDRNGKGVAVAELASPEVWLQDMSCRRGKGGSPRERITARDIVGTCDRKGATLTFYYCEQYPPQLRVFVSTVWWCNVQASLR